ncbi:hypothetical protein AX16_000317 [Volvariella volvacea WC 439]|nr:hypothetical protein AX16_000317 [Volvariella volvacea WC 439]
MSFTTATETSILLRPRPYAKLSGSLLLLPLLPQPRPLKPLPAEVWAEIFQWVLRFDAKTKEGTAWSLLATCKAFKDIALPLVYSHVSFDHTPSLEKFYNRLHDADQKWDSIRRIPYSTPGRWVQSIDLSAMTFSSQSQALQLDSLLTSLFPLVPFLSRFSMNPSFVLSRRALGSLADRPGAVNLRVIDGLSYVPASSSLPVREDHLVSLLKSCPNLEELEIIGRGPDPTELEFLSDTLWPGFNNHDLPLDPQVPLNLPKLHTLTLLSMHSSPLMTCLLFSPLPSLRKLTVTPYDDLPSSLVTQFIRVHGQGLRSLLMYTPKSWPTRLHPSPDSMLLTSPNLRHLSLETPIPSLVTPSSTHPLQILSIPRPTSDAWRLLESLLPKMPYLHVVRIRDVRWLRKGMNSRAQEAGVQGTMRDWRKRLLRRGIRILDADWNDHE